MKFILIIISVVFLSQNIYSQGVGVGEWRDHLSFLEAIDVTETDNLIYCATSSSVYTYNKSDNSINKLSKITGLSDFGISNIKYNKQYDVVLIAYSNTNVDIIKSGRIINIPDIKRKNIIGKKQINSITYNDKYAYLSCSFGIVVIDIDKLEIKDTYYIGVGGNTVEINGLTFDDNYFYAATSSGVYKASRTSANLSDYSSWIIDNRLSKNNYNHIVNYNDNIVVNLTIDIDDSDTMYVLKDDKWSYFDTTNYTKKYGFDVGYGYLLVSGYKDLSTYNSSFSKNLVWDAPYEPTRAIMGKNNSIWIAGNQSVSLVHFKKSGSSWNYGKYIAPDGPRTSNVVDIFIENSNVLVAPGGRNVSWAPAGIKDGVFLFQDNKWNSLKNTNNGFDTISDINCVIIHPSDNKRMYAASWGRGLVELYNNKIVKVYNQSNTDSNLLSLDIASMHDSRLGGMAFDSYNNLWISNSLTSKPLAVKMSNGTWNSFKFESKYSSLELGEMVIDNTNQKWIIIPRERDFGGIVVYNDNNTISVASDDKRKEIKTGAGFGNLPTNAVYSLAKDKNGEIWVGTSEGIAVFYNPEKVFSGENFDAQRILIEKDGHTQYLLETEQVNAIAIDGDNRKWIGTANSGVYLLSEDGTEELLHFTEENSPLFSNLISSIAIDGLTGEVFIGTDKGIISYKGTATESREDNNDVYVYPNPVHSGYDGLIAINGLVEDSYVKITDIAGNIIYETSAEGGQATWNGKNFSGNKAQSGVYLIFSSNPDGTQTYVSKVMLLN